MDDDALGGPKCSFTERSTSLALGGNIACFDAFLYYIPMADQLIDKAGVDRSGFTVTTLSEAEASDLAYWRSRTPDERLAALELSRQIAYGYDPSARGLSRFFEVVEFKPR